MSALLETRINPFERIRSTEGKVFLLLVGVAFLGEVFDLIAPAAVGWTLAEATGTLAYLGLGTYGTMRIVARPVRRATAHFEAIGRGDYTRPVRTRRTDEFGDMLRGLEHMRRNLCAAVAARDAAELKYRHIVERSVQGFYQSTEDGELLAANDALARLLGYGSAAQLLAEPQGITKRLHVDESRREAFTRQMRKEGVVHGFETALRRRDGSTVWVTESARAAKTADGGEYWEGFLDDITERKEAEQLKSDFVSFVTHQLRTPLSGIRWMLELASEADSPAEVRSFVQDAHSSAQRLIGLVNDLLDVARLEAGRFTTEPTLVLMKDVAERVTLELTPLAAARQQTLTFSGETSSYVLADHQLIFQAILNLVSNAIKYTPNRGTVRVLVTSEADSVTLHVHDTGIGIPEAAQRRLFEKFFRADNAQVIDTEGTGLGLYLVRLIAERSGGSVTCHSVEGTGTTFALRLPAAVHREAVS